MNRLALYLPRVKGCKLSNKSYHLISAFLQSAEYGSESNSMSLPSHARVIVCGSGIVGCSIAYHLTKMGETEVLLLDKGSVGEGATSYSAGIVGQLKGSTTESKMIQYSVQLYKELSEKHGLEYTNSGTLVLTRSPDRLHQYERKHQTAQRIGVKTHMLSPDEALRKYPYINDAGLLGAMWIPEDIIIDTKKMTRLLATIAEQNGATVVENCEVKSITTDSRTKSTSAKVTGVKTASGNVTCDYFINACGQWSRQLGKLGRPRVGVPIHSVEHYYLLAKPEQPLDEKMPVIRDYDNHCYFRAWGDSIMAGGFEETAKPIFHDGVPDNFNCSQDKLPEDWDHLQFMLDKVLLVLPSMQNATIEDVVTGAEAFTPDRHWIIGQAPQLSNYYLAAGFCGAGTAAAGGVGLKIAQLITKDETIDWHDAVDIKRFVDLHNNIKYLRARCKEVVGFEYGLDNARPNKEYKSARSLRVSPLYTRAEKYGAVFGENVGFERALYFNSNAPEVESANYKDTSFGKPNYFDIVKTEYWACRENVCLVDMSSFAKAEIRSDNTKELIDFLQHLCANDIDKPIGTVIHTGMLNKHGGFENDCSLFRLHENKFLIVSPASQQTRNLWWINRHMPENNTSLQTSDVTSMYSVINVIGPKARELLAELTDVSLLVADFPHMTGKPLYVANAGGILAMRLTHAGEDGFVLYIPSEYALHVYDTLMQVGENYGIRNAGYYALRSLRTEKFFAYWGTDLNSNVTPLECGRDHRVKLSSGINFQGRDALMKQKTDGIKKRMVMFTLYDHDETRDNFPWSGEPIFRNGRFVGSVSSSAYGYTLEKQVCLGFIRHAEDPDLPISIQYVKDKSATYEISIGSKLFKAKPYAYPPKIEASNLGFYLPAQKLQNQ